MSGRPGPFPGAGGRPESRLEPIGWRVSLFGARELALDKHAAGVTLAAEGNGIRITIAAGTGPHADPTDGAYALWSLRSSVNGSIVRYDLPALGGAQGAIGARLDVIEGIGANDGIEISIGTSQGSAVGDQATLGGLLDASVPTLTAMRKLGGSLARVVDASPSGEAAAAVVLPAYNVGSAQLIGGTNIVIGSTNNDLSIVKPAISSPFDVVSGPGNLSILQYLTVNVRCTTLTTAPRSYLIRPSSFVVPWSATP